MIDLLKKKIANCKTDYADLRFEVDRIVRINMRGKEINSISDSVKEGYHVRVLAKGGLSTNTICDKKQLSGALRTSRKAARLSSRYVGQKIQFKTPPVLKEKVIVTPKEDPRSVTLKEKLELLKHYNDLILSVPAVQSTNLIYSEWTRQKYFVNLLGAEIEQEQILCFISGEIIARTGTKIENIRVAIGGCDDFSKMRNREDLIERRAKIAVDLLNAEPVRSGVYRVLLNPHMVGVFIHEAFGHLSEADSLVENPGLLKRLPIGMQIGTECLSVIDDPTLYGYPGYRVYDDEGVRCSRTYLIKNGTLSGHLHSMATAASLDEELSGHCIAVGWNYTPIVRMGNIYIEPGNKSYEELLSSIEDGLYLCDAKGGSTMGDQFAFGAQYGYEVKNGKLGKMVKCINMSGNLFKTLKEIIAVGNDLGFNEAGGCGKDGQLNPASGTGGPHTIIDNIVIG